MEKQRAHPRVHAKESVEKHGGSAGLIQSPASENRGEERKKNGRLGRNSRSQSAEGHRDSIVARSEVARRSCAAWLVEHPFHRLLSGSRGAGIDALCGGPFE